MRAGGRERSSTSVELSCAVADATAAPRRCLLLCLALLVFAACAGAYAGAKIGGDGSAGSCLAPANLFGSYGRLPLGRTVQDDLDSLREDVGSGAISGIFRDLVEQALSLTDVDAASAAVRLVW